VSVEQTARQTSGNAIASVVLGTVGFVLWLAFIPSILAIVFGNRARAEIRANPSMAGEGLATAGIIVGWVGIAIPAAIGLIALLFLLPWYL
jgi:mannose/fructose/N-acetylgalactosamine-specific phosphotransferase system component IIC